MPNKNDCCVLKCLIRAGAPKAAIKKYTNKCYPQPETQQGLGDSNTDCGPITDCDHNIIIP